MRDRAMTIMRIDNSKRKRSADPLALPRRPRIRRVARRLVEFHANCRRSFPWRRQPTPYSVAIAEVLLQRTRAEAVVPTHSYLLKYYPTPKQLSRAPVRLLERALRPLGLWRKRARQLVGLGTALARHGVGELADRENSVRFPAVGTYAASAIACFAFGRAVGIVDANTRRIFTRVFGLPRLEPRARFYQTLADSIAKCSSSPAAANYALLDIGALYCQSIPKCHLCPLERVCDYAKRTIRIEEARKPS